MSNQIPGVPEGWVIDHIGKPIFNVDWVIGFDGQPRLCDYDSGYLNRVVIRKIEKPAKYRPFKDAEEYLPYWGKPVIHQGCVGFDSIVSTSSFGVYVARARTVQFFTLDEAFEVLKFADGTPFGVRIDG